jgi:hypothetical protein
MSDKDLFNLLEILSSLPTESKETLPLILEKNIESGKTFAQTKGVDIDISQLFSNSNISEQFLFTCFNIFDQLCVNAEVPGVWSVKEEQIVKRCLQAMPRSGRPC